MMDGTQISVPLRASNISGKKMRKRRELDALVAANGGLKRYSGYVGGPVCVKPGTNYHDQLLSESSDEPEDYWRARNKANHKRNRTRVIRKRCSSVLGVCTLVLAFGCVIVTSTMLWLFLDVRHQANYLQYEIDQVTSGNIPESLQRCHQKTKELQQNQSDMYSNFVKLNSKLSNLSSEISVISQDLSTVRNKLNISIGSDVPINVKYVLENITMLNNCMKELNKTVMKISDSHLEILNFTSLKSLEKFENLSSFTYNNISQRLNDLEEEFHNISQKSSIMRSFPGQLDSSHKTSNTADQNTNVPKGKSPAV